MGMKAKAQVYGMQGVPLVVLQPLCRRTVSPGYCRMNGPPFKLNIMHQNTVQHNIGIMGELAGYGGCLRKLAGLRHCCRAGNVWSSCPPIVELPPYSASLLVRLIWLSHLLQGGASLHMSTAGSHMWHFSSLLLTVTGDSANQT